MYSTIIGLGAIKHYTNREEESIRLVTMVAKPLDINKSWSCKYDRENTQKMCV